MKTIPLLILSIVLLAPRIAVAQDPPSQQPQQSPANGGATAGAAVATQQRQQTQTSAQTQTQVQAQTQTQIPARVEKAWSDEKSEDRIRLRGNVSVFVSNYAQLQSDAAAAGKPVTLWINGRDSNLIPEKVVETVAKTPDEYRLMLAAQAERDVAREKETAETATPAKSAPAAHAADPTSVVLTFQLERTDGNKDLWKTLLEDPFQAYTRSVVVSVGVSGAKPIQASQQMVVQKRDPGRTKFWVGIFIVVLLAFLFTANKTEILRNGPDFEVNNVTKKQAYSLGRCQMAWWFFLILVGYVTIWLISGDQDTLTTSLLTLMGISAATALSAVAIDSSSDVTSRTKLIEEQAAAQKKLADVQAQIAQVSAGQAVPTALTDAQKTLQDRLDAIPDELAALKLPIENQRWFLDILRDDNGTIALHRLQIVVWTIVLGLMFIYSVYSTLSMPEFSATLLALMGVSATTYIGFKLPSS